MDHRPRNPSLYSHRNLLHAKAVGAVANAESALKRLLAMRRPPQWLVKYLEGIIERGKPVADEMAKHRDEAW